MKEYRERASQIGKIMTNPRSKSEEISKSALSRVQEAMLQEKFGIKKVFWSKAMDKGNECEDDSIELFGRVYGIFNLKKNEESFENDHFTGTPDLLHEDIVIDVKSSWDGNTFPWFEDEIPNKDYYYQLQAYMDLAGKDRAILAYCLVNAKEDMILDEIRRQAWQNKMIESSNEFDDSVRAQMEFDHIPEVLRIKAFEFKRDQDVIDQMKERVELCRKYYHQYSDQLNAKNEFLTIKR
tara:strand:+ start:59 stop:772 length:714 start_codon:yes stop_codon:yes gene_type:complete